MKVADKVTWGVCAWVQKIMKKLAVGRVLASFVSNIPRNHELPLSSIIQRGKSVSGSVSAQKATSNFKYWAMCTANIVITRSILYVLCFHPCQANSDATLLIVCSRSDSDSLL